MYKTMEEAIQDLKSRNYSPTPEEQEQMKKFKEKSDWWLKRGNEALWETDGISLTAFVSSAAFEDLMKQHDRILNGGLGVFRVFIRLSDEKVITDIPEYIPVPGMEWKKELKWVVRTENGKMQKGEDGRWLVFPFEPKRESTHTKRGYAVRWAVLPYVLVDIKENFGSVMSRGTARSQLERRIVFK